ncbi:TPA: YggT family protein, partial [Enterococcus faecium]|nr:YggT family protein [Enterococcus faecium]
MLVFRLLNLFSDAVYLYTVLLVIYALLSWFPGGYQSAFGRFLAKICEPYLGLFDRLNLSFAGIDFTIAFAIIVLQLATQGLFVLLQA